MVHGGGHHYSVSQHQHHDSGEVEQRQSSVHSWGSDEGGWGWRNQQRGAGGFPWGWWGPQTINQNVDAVDNTRNRGRRSRASTSAGSDECEQCCRKCCLGCCTCWFATAVAQEAPRCGPMSHWIFLSVCLFILLVVMSTMDRTWTFNAGETRRIPTRPILTSHVQIQSQVANGIVVYDIHGKCPALVGPTVSLDESWNLHLAPDDYQFDYYYLTKGSSLTVSFQQRRGATDISLLKGMNQLHAVQGDEDYPSFSSQALLTRYTAAVSCEHHHKCKHGAPCEHPKCSYGPPITIVYTVPESDVYIIVYDNASASPGRANSTIHVNLATYDLEKQVPYAGCEALTCSVDTKKKECLLLQAPSGGPLVTVHITAKRRWLVITSIALVPMLIAIGLQVRRLVESRRAEQGEMPPATNPEALLSGGDTVDYESIPIVAAEDVVPVAVPVDATAK